jgi:hypothetical protein
MIFGPGLERVGGGAPRFGDGGFGRRHRDLREAAWDERRKDHGERLLLLVEGPAGEHDAVAAADGLRSRRETRVGRLEAEAVSLLDGKYLLSEAAGQGEEVPRVAFGGDAAAEASHGVRGQRRGHKEATRFEVEGWVDDGSNPVRSFADPFAPILAIPSTRFAHAYGREGA